MTEFEINNATPRPLTEESLIVMMEEIRLYRVKAKIIDEVGASFVKRYEIALAAARGSERVMAHVRKGIVTPPPQWWKHPVLASKLT